MSLESHQHSAISFLKRKNKDLLTDGMAALQKKAFPAVNGDGVAEMNDIPVYFTPLFTFINMQILAADNAGFFELCCDNRGMGSLAAPGGEQPLRLGNFPDVLRNGILADQDQGAVRVLPAYLVNILPGKNGDPG